MGMFDYVNFKIACPKCGKEIDDFQSKDNICELKKLEFWEVDNFYGLCDNCDTIVEFTLRKAARAKLTLSDYKQKITNAKEG